MTTINDLLQHTSKVLAESPCHGDTARLDADILLAHVLGCERTWLIAHGDKPLRASAILKFRSLIHRRAQHEPVAYLIGHKEFYGLQFKVNRSVLIPRPETELLVSLATIASGAPAYRQGRKQSDRRSLPPRPPEQLFSRAGSARGRDGITFIDLGTGSGAIAIAIAKTIPGAHIVATDVSPAALRVARENAERHGVQARIKFVRTNTPPILPSKRGGTARELSPPLRGATRGNVIIVANLPYLTTKQWGRTTPEIRNYEPRRALDAGRDGLRYYRALIKQLALSLSYRKKIEKIIFLEIDPSQKQKLRMLVRSYLPRATVRFHTDLAGTVRIGEIASSRSAGWYKRKNHCESVHPRRTGEAISKDSI